MKLWMVKTQGVGVLSMSYYLGHLHSQTGLRSRKALENKSILPWSWALPKRPHSAGPGAPLLKITDLSLPYASP